MVVIRRRGSPRKNTFLSLVSFACVHQFLCTSFVSVCRKGKEGQWGHVTEWRKPTKGSHWTVSSGTIFCLISAPGAMPADSSQWILILAEFTCFEIVSCWFKGWYLGVWEEHFVDQSSIIKTCYRGYFYTFHFLIEILDIIKKLIIKIILIRNNGKFSIGHQFRDCVL